MSVFNERSILLTAHIASAVVLVGPVTVATSLFPSYGRPATVQVAEALHRITRLYGLISIVVGTLGLILAQRTGYAGQAWVNVSLGLFIAAYLLLLGAIVPGQARVLAAIDGWAEPTGRDLAPLRALAGLFAVAWVTILVLMVTKPS